jgi:ABC-type multidrug transport system fused ATPase/permease subunit
MVDERMNDGEITERIMNDVEDSVFRKQLVKMVADRKNPGRDKQSTLQKLGIKQDAIPKNIKLMRRVNATICSFFIIGGGVGLLFSRNTKLSLFLLFWILFIGVIFYITNKFYNNIFQDQSDT